MAPIALFLCLILISSLLLIDSRRRGRTSAALWLPTAMVFVLASRTPSLWFGQHTVVTGLPNDAAGNMLDQIFFVSIMVGSAVVATSRRVRWSRLFAANSALMLLYLFFVVSTLWSGDPSGTFKRAVKDFGSTVVVILVVLSE